MFFFKATNVSLVNKTDHIFKIPYFLIYTDRSCHADCEGLSPYQKVQLYFLDASSLNRLTAFFV